MKRYIFNLILLFGITLFYGQEVKSQNKDGGVEIKAKVVDEAGSPIPSAKIYYKEGAKITYSLADGTFNIITSSDDVVVVESKDYEQVVTTGSAISGQNVTLIRKPKGLKTSDQVNVPFGTLSARNITGAATVLKTDEIMQYDYRQGLTGAINGRVSGMFGSTNMRGIGSAVMVIDGIPRPDANINLAEVESITVLKDITSRVLYGPQAENGVILVTTKRGKAYKRVMNVSVEQGLSTPISYPEFMNSSDYMNYYNQACENDGLPLKYSADQISGAASGANNLKYPDEDYYNATFLKDRTYSTNVNAEASGGNESAQYFLSLGWSHNTGLLQKIWSESYNQGTDQFNVRGNVDYKINEYMKMHLDGVVYVNIDNQPRFSDFDKKPATTDNFFGITSSLRPNIYPALIDASLLPASLQQSAKLYNGKYVLGGTSEYTTNIYGELARNGYLKSTTRVLQNNTGIDFDLKSIAKGLTAKAYLTFDMYNLIQSNFGRTYSVYQPGNGKDVNGADSLTFTKVGADVNSETPTISNVNFYRKIGLYGLLNYAREFSGVHKLNATALAYTDRQDLDAVLQSEKNATIGLTANYSYKDKYVVQASLVSVGTNRLSKENRWGTTPTVGLSWIASEENFLKGNSFIDYLKVNANAGSISSSQGLTYRQYITFYSQGTNYNYNFAGQSNNERNLNYGNPDLTWAKRSEASFGFEAVLMKGMFDVNAAAFTSTQTGSVIQRTNAYPSYVQYPFENYGETNQKGIEWGVNYNVKIGKALLTIGHNAVYSVPKTIKSKELDYTESWRKRTGVASDAIFGLQDLGLYQTSDFNTDGSLVAGNAIPIFGTVKPGDIKYQDKNGDGFISSKDEQIIGNSSSRIQYGLTINLKVSDFELFVMGTGQNGAERNFNSEYYWVYGDRKYSEVVRNSWTEENAASADYPRLTTLSNANNFQNSTYWLKANNYFTLNAAQLSYNVPYTSSSKIFMKSLQVYARGGNLMTISKNKERRELNIGSAPQMRYYSVGVVAKF